MTISHEHKFIWFRVPKTGTRTVLNLLHRHIETINSNRKPPNCNQYFKFTFVRNPWDRIVSCYHNKVLKKWPTFKECFDKSFEDFVDYIDKQDLVKADRHIRLQTKLLPVKDLDFIGRFEQFEEDLKLVLDKIGIEGYEIEHRNKSVHKHYSAYYTARTREIIERKYKKDIETFGYTFEDVENN